MNRTWRVATLLFFSGMAALIYQTVWLREFRLIFGASTSATAAVLAIFMGGLGAGSALLGKRADAHPFPLVFYGNLELLIAGAAVLSLPLLFVVEKIYLATGGSIRLGLTVATVIRLVLATLVLLVPTMLMGGTLPGAARAVESRSDEGRGRLALLYGLNTLGAVTGTLLSTFFMLEIYGNRKTLLIAALVNSIIALIARGWGRTLAPEESELPAQAGVDEAIAEPRVELPPRLVLLAAAVAGFAFLLMELVWYRLLGPILGGTTFTFGLILAMALLGIGAGGAAYSLWNRASVGALAITCALEALAIAIPFALGDRLAVLANLMRPLGTIGFTGHMLSWTLLTSIVVFPAAFIAGIQFPLLIALLGRGREDVGRHVGQAYAWNTFGSILGSLAGGFGLMPLLSAPGSWRTVTVILAALAFFLALYAYRNAQPSSAIVSGLAAGIAFVCIFALGPTAAWRHSGVGAGRAEQPTSVNAYRQWLNLYRQRLLWDRDGRESSIGLVVLDDTSLVVNGKSDGSARSDSGTQIMSALLGPLLHRNPRSTLVIGLGTGTTAGWVARIPTIERVDAVELEPVVVDAANDFAAVNEDVLRNPKVKMIVADGREVLLTTREMYDIISSEPSNPYRAGIASLFTREYYEAVDRRLAPGGIFMQWMQSYDIGAATFRTIFATVRAVFPHIEIYWTQYGDLMLLASKTPIVYDVEAMRARLLQEPYRRGVRHAWRVESVEGIMAHYVGNERLAKLLADQAEAQNTDDRTVVEFGFARELASKTQSLTLAVLQLAQATGHDRPVHVRGAIDWNLVALNRASTPPLNIPPRAAGDQWSDHHSFATLYNRGDLASAVALWRARRFEPVNSAETSMLADALSDASDAEAVKYIEMLRPIEPIEADVISARLLFRRGQQEQALALLEKSFVALRTNPWPMSKVIDRGLNTALELARRNPAVAARVRAALSRKFAAGQWDYSRTVTHIAASLSAEGCGPNTIAALRAVEDAPPWSEFHLATRRNCYAKAGLGDLSARAERDYAAFKNAEPEPLVAP